MSIDEEKAATVAGPQEGAPSGPGAPAAADHGSADAAGSASGANAPKKPRRRGWIVAGVVAAVIVVAGAGFWVWHEQPSFCNAICHSPMDYYVETHDDGNPQLGVTAHVKHVYAKLGIHSHQELIDLVEG